MYILPQALLKFILVPRAGVEPTTLSLGRICSIQLSYRGMNTILTDCSSQRVLLQHFFRRLHSGFSKGLCALLRSGCRCRSEVPQKYSLAKRLLNRLSIGFAV